MVAVSRALSAMICILVLFGIAVLAVQADSNNDTGNTGPTTRPVFFIFGDSLADVGNNNFLPSLVRANFPPNGLDFPGGGHPTGRFCNGFLVLDALATQLGYPISLPYLSPATKGPAILQAGVNYASGGCGILNETGNGGCLPMSKQVYYHKKTVSSMIGQVGIDRALKLLQSSVYWVVAGSNDFLGNYLRGTPDSKQFSPSGFGNLLVSTLSRHVKDLYEQGARKIVIVGLGPVGCVPKQRANTSDGSCNEELNSWVVSLNQGFESTAEAFSSTLPGAKVTFANPYGILDDMLKDPSKYGLNVTSEACCGRGRLHAAEPCVGLLGAEVCADRSGHLFWDAWHPTQQTNLLVARAFLMADQPSTAPAFVRPWTIQQLIAS